MMACVQGPATALRRFAIATTAMLIAFAAGAAEAGESGALPRPENVFLTATMSIDRLFAEAGKPDAAASAGRRALRRAWVELLGTAPVSGTLTVFGLRDAASDKIVHLWRLDAAVAPEAVARALSRTQGVPERFGKHRGRSGFRVGGNALVATAPRVLYLGPADTIRSLLESESASTASRAPRGAARGAASARLEPLPLGRGDAVAVAYTPDPRHYPDKTPVPVEIRFRADAERLELASRYGAPLGSELAHAALGHDRTIAYGAALEWIADGVSPVWDEVQPSLVGVRAARGARTGRVRREGNLLRVSLATEPRPFDLLLRSVTLALSQTGKIPGLDAQAELCDAQRKSLADLFALYLMRGGPVPAGGRLDLRDFRATGFARKAQGCPTGGHVVLERGMHGRVRAVCNRHEERTTLAVNTP